MRCKACGELILVEAESGPPPHGSAGMPTAIAPEATSPQTATPLPHAPVEQWHVYAHDGKQYGPIPRLELDQWVAQGLLSPNCQLLREGQEQWQPAAAIFPQLAAPHLAGAQATGNSGSVEEDNDDEEYTPSLRATGKKKTLANLVVSSELKRMPGASLVSSDVYDVGERRSLLDRLKASVVVGPIQEHESHIDSLQCFRFRDELGEFAAIVPYDNGMVAPLEFLARLPGRLPEALVLLKQSGGRVAMEAGAVLGGPLGLLLKSVGTQVESVWAGVDGSVPPLAQALNGTPALNAGVRWEGTIGGGPRSTIYRLSWGVQAIPLDDDSYLLVAQGVPKQKMLGLELGIPWFHAYRRQFGQFVLAQNASPGAFDLYSSGVWLYCAIEVFGWVEV